MPKSSRRSFLATGLGAAATVGLARGEGSGELAELTLKQASDRVRSKKVTPIELTEACLDRIKTYNPKINAWITVMREKALAQARTLTDEQAAGRLRSPLHGIPIGIKDSIDTAGTRTTAASAVYEYRFPSEDAEVVRRLKAAGAVIIGKCNMHEFDAGSSSAVSYWGPVRNPWNLERVTGGASGGPAAAVALENCYAALGTEAGGGIRTAAGHCGVIGLKPTYGRVSMRGIVPYAWSLDHCGPLARTVEDAALVLQQIAGYDRLDVDSADRPVGDYASAVGADVGRFRIGVPIQFFDHLDEDVARAIADAIAVLNKLTKGSQDVIMPSLLHAGVGAEIAATHEGLRGVNGGGYEPSTARVFPGTQDATRAADYIRGWRALELVRRTVDEDVFQKQNVDLLVAPVSRHAAPTIEEELVPAGVGGGSGGRAGRGGGVDATAAAPATANARPRGTWDPEENTRSFNGYGLPTMVVPCGFFKDGMPIGLQISGPHFAEIQVMAMAHAYQEATEWHKRRPGLQPDTKVPTLSRAAAEQTGG